MMPRRLIPPCTLAASLALLLSGCAGTSPSLITTEPPAPHESPHEDSIDATAELHDILTFLYDTHGSDLESVKARLKTLTRHAPSFAQAHFNLGLVAHISAEPDQARDHYTRALALDPKLAAAHINLGILAIDARNDGQAQRHFETALQRSPANPIARENLTTLLTPLLSTHKNAPHLRPRLVRLVEKGGAQWTLGKRDAALTTFRHALDVYDALDDDQQRRHLELAAHAAWMLAEDAHERALAMKIDATQGDALTAQTREKMAAHQEAIVRFEHVLSFNHPQWTVAALVRIGEGPRDFSESFRRSAVPAQLSEEQHVIYRRMLEDRAAQITEHAYNAFTTALQTAQNTGIISAFTYNAAFARYELDPTTHVKPRALPFAGQPRSDGFTLHGFLALPPDTGEDESGEDESEDIDEIEAQIRRLLS
ncbi:tetratricopeptide repeat protein [Bradymonadaceae bacterium TMQ3]|nr:tetratricopeptide repeat protein [Bradymonadaceae bacterium TMQ3]TXC74518.1 tetratricopeptide repeat protein [Bradymonadales bacterium TMQ1]